jgi:NAD-dependent DNA ligase
MTFGNWDESIHESIDQQKRKASAVKAEITPLSVNSKVKSGEFQGRHGHYNTTIETCDCGDFFSRKLPCKHIYRLAAELGIYELGAKIKSVKAAIPVPQEELRADTLSRFIDAISIYNGETQQAIKSAFMVIDSLSGLRIAQEYLLSTLGEATGHSVAVAKTVTDNRFINMTFAITGTLSSFSRDEAASFIERYGGRVSGSVSKSTTYLIAGENAASKLQKALSLGIPVLSESEFEVMLK